MGNPCFFSLSNASRMKCNFGHGLRPHGCAMVLRHGIEQQQRGRQQGPHGLFRLPRISRLHFRNTYRRERERWIDTIDRQTERVEGRRETDVEQRSSLPSVLRSVGRGSCCLSCLIASFPCLVPFLFHQTDCIQCIVVLKYWDVPLELPVAVVFL